MEKQILTPKKRQVNNDRSQMNKFSLNTTTTNWMRNKQCLFKICRQSKTTIMIKTDGVGGFEAKVSRPGFPTIVEISPS